MKPRLRAIPPWQLVVTATLATVSIYFGVAGPNVQEVVYFGFGFGGACTMLLRARRLGGRSQLTAVLIGMALLLISLGDGIWAYDELIRHRETPFPSVADVLYLAGYPLQFAALWLALRRRSPGGDRAGVLDAAVMACGASSLAWTFLIRDYALDPRLTFLARAVSMAYPVMDVLLLGIVARLLFAPGRRRAVDGWLATALVLTLLADLVYLVQSAQGSYASGTWVDGAWLLAYGAWVVAVLHPSAGELASPGRHAPRESVGRWRLLLLAGAALLAPACMVFWIGQRTAPDIIVMAATAAIAFGLVMVRLAGALRALSNAHGAIEAAQLDRQQLLHQVVQVGERERSRVAADLHDGPIQALSALGFDLELALLSLAEGDLDDVRTVIERTASTLSSEVSDIRRLMAALRPPVLDEGGLAFALEELLRAMTERHGLRGVFTTDMGGELSPDVETTLYRMTQEALSNVARHGAASAVAVQLDVAEGWAQLRVVDDGVGFEPGSLGDLVRTGHFGLAGMSERAEASGGQLTVRSAAGCGTAVLVRVPCGASIGASPAVAVAASTDGPPEEGIGPRPGGVSPASPRRLRRASAVRPAAAAGSR